VQTIGHNIIHQASGRPNIRRFSSSELEELFQKMGEKPFRARQVHKWLWKKSAKSFAEMTDLPLTVRAFLESHFEIHQIIPQTIQRSSDKTIKAAFGLHDGRIVEGVLIPTGTRMTACISSQVGCSLDCRFCATGRLKLARNLEPDEIYDQVVELNKMAIEVRQKPLSNIVFMGMGEPLLNYKNMMRSIDMITSDKGLGMSNRRITVSTSGIAKMIRRLGDDEVKFNLAVSLHAANDEKRSRMMSINESNPLREIAEALKYFYSKTGTRVTYEYIVFKDFNDSLEDARELAEFSKIVPCKVNIIEYNPIENGEFEQASQPRLRAFIELLEHSGVIVNVRRSRGKDIDAACGQLANKH
jgi:23S rRNA (adenine2503-C2)-methyltransferase